MIKGCGINNFPRQCPASSKSKAHGIMFEEELVMENPDDSSCVSILETPKRPKRNRKRTRSGQHWKADLMKVISCMLPRSHAVKQRCSIRKKGHR